LGWGFEKQIPRGNDNKKGKGKSRSPCEEWKARKANAKARPLQFSSEPDFQ
jgi:hypothetical protein